MKMKRKIKIEIAVTLAIVIGLFILVSLIVNHNLGFFKDLIQDNYILGIVVFILFEVVSIVIAPITSIPLIPIASMTYGVFLTSIFNIVGGIIGSMIDFWIGRSFGKRFAARFVSIEQAESAIQAISKKNKFLTMIILRMIAPPDVLSYGLGIFTKIGYGFFIITMIIGIVPGSVYIAFLGSLPILYQLAGWILGAIIILLTLAILFRKK